jgi:hypothetical protein
MQYIFVWVVVISRNNRKRKVIVDSNPLRASERARKWLKRHPKANAGVPTLTTGLSRNGSYRRLVEVDVPVTA